MIALLIINPPSEDVGSCAGKSMMVRRALRQWKSMASAVEMRLPFIERRGG
jgi:hypothetical protein